MNQYLNSWIFGSKEEQRKKQKYWQVSIVQPATDKFQGFWYIIVNGSGREANFFGYLFCWFAFLPAFQEDGFLPFREFINDLLNPFQNRLIVNSFFNFKRKLRIFGNSVTDEFLKVIPFPKELADIVVCYREKIRLEW